jgi:hypothetical protein
MKTGWWYLIGIGVGIYLIAIRSKQTLYVDRAGTSYYQTKDFANDSAASATVTAPAPPMVPTQTAEQINPELNLWSV